MIIQTKEQQALMKEYSQIRKTQAGFPYLAVLFRSQTSQTKGNIWMRRDSQKKPRQTTANMVEVGQMG